MDFVLTFISNCFICMLFIDKVSAADNCQLLNTCSCKTSSGFVVDLHGLIGPQANNPRFTADTVKYTYNYEPCNPLNTSCGSGPQKDEVSVCQVQKGGTVLSYNAGDVKSAIFKGDPHDGTLSIHYSGFQGVTRSTLIALKCGNSAPTLTVISEEGSTYHLELVTSAVCIPTPTKPTNKNISTGSVLLILFFVFLAVYFVAGILFLKYVRKAQGTEIIPNYEFWTSIPGLVKEGCMFVFRGCKTERTYSQI